MGEYSLTASADGYSSSTMEKIKVEKKQVNYPEWFYLKHNSDDVLSGTSLKIGSNTAYPIKLNGTAIESGIITAGTTVTMTFTGSAYEITVIPITNSAIDSLFTS